MAFNLDASLNGAGTNPSPVDTPVSLPDNGPTLPSFQKPNVVGPTPPQSPGALPVAGTAHEGLVGKAFGHILSGLSGTEQSYTVDPNTGQTVTTTTKAPPGQWARGVLAAGLLGSSDINPQHGENNFAQGLIAGLGGGARARQQMNMQDDAKKREQAQQDYVNNLKAQENTRQDKELNLRETLNKAQVAHENIATSVQSQMLHEMFIKEQGTASNLLIDGSKDKVQDYINAGEKPFKEGMTEDELQQLMQTDKGAAAKYVGLPTGQKVVKSADGTNQIETTYSLFAPLTKVPETLVNRMKDEGLDKTAPAMYKEMADAAAGGKDVDYRKIAIAQKEVGKQFDFQKSLDDHRLKLAEISKDLNEGFAASFRAQKDKYDFAKEKAMDNGQQVYNSYFNPQTGDLGKVDPETGQLSKVGLESTKAEFVANWQKSHKGATPSEKEVNDGLKKAAQNRSDLNGYMDNLNQYYQNELLKYARPTKDAYGNPVYTDPYASAIGAIQNNLIKGVTSLHDGITPKPQDQIQQTVQQKVIGQATKDLGPGAGTAMNMVLDKFPNFTDLGQALDYASQIPTGQKFTPEMKIALIQKLPSYYDPLRVETKANQEKQQQVDAEVQKARLAVVKQAEEDPDSDYNPYPYKAY